jgi:hypothetical protein
MNTPVQCILLAEIQFILGGGGKELQELQEFRSYRIRESRCLRRHSSKKSWSRRDGSGRIAQKVAKDTKKERGRKCVGGRGKTCRRGGVESLDPLPLATGN